MKYEEIAKTLHPLERSVLPGIAKQNTVEQICEKTNLQDVEVVRAIQWLKAKGLVEVSETKREILSLTVLGEEYSKTSLPEYRFLRAVQSPTMLKDIPAKASLGRDEFNVSIGMLRKEGMIGIQDSSVRITSIGKKHLNNLESTRKLLKKLEKSISSEGINPKHRHIVNDLKKRGIIESKEKKFRRVSIKPLGKRVLKHIRTDMIDKLTTQIISSGTWKKKEIRPYDVMARVPEIYPGKKHFIRQAIDYIRRIWIEMGFKEMKAPMVELSFWNFDALFTPQDHPAREMQDTFFMKKPRYGQIPKNKVSAVKKAHETGVAGSKGWGYKWDEKISKQLVLRTHTTSLSARKLATMGKEDIPGKFFSVGKVFRNETLDWKHLAEFYQTDGIVVDPDVNFKHLLGYLKRYLTKMGFGRARFRPGYFPYTEMSVEAEVYVPEHRAWKELFGAGIFRPEVVEPLLGIDIPVLAWGPGFGRIIMDAYEIKDMRDLYSNDLKHLRKARLF